MAGPDAGDIRSGTLSGFNAFCDWAIGKGVMTGAAVEPLRSATKQILTTVEPANHESVDLRTIDPDDYMGRFENLAGSRYSPDSLQAYRRRFSRGLELYRQYLDTGAANFKPPAGRAPRRRATVPPGGGSGRAATPVADNTGQPPQLVEGLIDYPFPLRSGTMAHLYLPKQLEKEDAERMAAYLRALVLEPQRQIAAASDAA